MQNEMEWFWIVRAIGNSWWKTLDLFIQIIYLMIFQTLFTRAIATLNENGFYAFHYFIIHIIQHAQKTRILNMIQSFMKSCYHLPFLLERERTISQMRNNWRKTLKRHWLEQSDLFLVSIVTRYGSHFVCNLFCLCIVYLQGAIHFIT